MRGNDLIGIIFSSTEEKALKKLTQFRAAGAIPFAGKYKLIDFPLSNMSNSGINKVGIIVKNNYKSLMDHLGSGKPWNLSKINGGLFILPPYITGNNLFENKIDTLFSIKDFILSSKENYVLLCDCNLICNINYVDALKSHIKNNADITLICRKEKDIIQKTDAQLTYLKMDKTNKVKSVLIGNFSENEKSEYLYSSLGMMIFNKNLLLDLIGKCKSQGLINFEKDVIQNNTAKLNIYGYEITSFAHKISSFLEYFNCNMSVINENTKNELFNPQNQIHTKSYNTAPAKYTKNCKISNSLISNGCTIDGKITNSILFEGVCVEKNACISNSIIMSNSKIGYGCRLNYTVVDENTTINMGRTFMGFKSYPVYIENSKII